MVLGLLGFLGVIIFGIMWIVSLIRKNGKAKRNIIITGICFLLFIVGVVNSSNSNDDDNAKDEDRVEETSADQKDDSSKKDKPTEKDESKKEKKKDERNIAEKLQEDDDNVDEASIEDGVLTLKTEGKTTFSENTLFHSVYDLFEAMHEGFNDKDINKVEVALTTTMVDAKGNESDDDVITFEYSRESFEELNYDKFSEMAYGQQWRILNESDSYSIHPGIYKNLKDEYTNNLSHGMAK